MFIFCYISVKYILDKVDNLFMCIYVNYLFIVILIKKKIFKLLDKVFLKFFMIICFFWFYSWFIVGEWFIYVCVLELKFFVFCLMWNKYEKNIIFVI